MLLNFLNSGFGVLLSASILGAIGLFTWQRLDWVSKERYLHTQVMLDRQLDLLDSINKDIGKLIALAASFSAPILKGNVSKIQTEDSVRTYNEFQASWFGLCESYKTSLLFYFSKEIVDSFTRVIKSTENLDISLGQVKTRDDAEKAYEAGLAIYDDLREFNTKVVSKIKNVHL